MEENKKGKNNKKIIIGVIIGIIIVALIGVIVFLGLQLNKNQMNNNNNENSNIQDENKENNANNASKNTTKVNTLSFKQMEYNDNSLTEDQKIIAKYFDEDYFFLNTYEELVRYADMLKNINVSCYGQVNSIVSSEGENFEAVCQWGSAYDSFWGVENAELTEPIIIKGKKPEKMVIKGDSITLKGKMIGAETRNINGENKYLPVIEITEIGEEYWYSEDTIRKVANLVFGKNIKVRRPTDDETQKMVSDCGYTYENFVWLSEFENQSNLNFKVFDIWQSEPYGMITYNVLYNQGVEKGVSNKRLYITPDLQKYIVFDLSVKDKYVYISVYDRNLNKLWSREISNASIITWDATNTNLAFVSDNDFYNINIETGEDIFAPVLVGKKNQVRCVENGYILVSEDSDDNIIFLDTNGNIKNKFDIKLGTNKQPNQKIYSTIIQKIDNNYVILYNIYDINAYEATHSVNSSGAMYDYKDIYSSKYIIINENGEKIKESE